MKDRRKLDIEICHIYLNEAFGQEQLDCIEAFKDFRESNKETDIHITTSIMLDDISSDEKSLDVEQYLDKVRSFGIIPDFLIYESAFAEKADLLINDLPKDSLKKEYFRDRDVDCLIFQNPQGQKIGLKEISDAGVRYTCSALSCTWTLCRLGIYPFPSQSLISLTGKTWDAEFIKTFIPKKYIQTEDKVFQLIQAAGHESALERFENIFY